MTTTCFINSFDYTEAFVNATGSYTGSSLNGIYMITGTVTLAATPKINKPFDDRYNTDFGRGRLVEIELFGSKANIMGTTYILTARFDPQTTRITITVGCILALLNSRTPENLAICVQAEQGVPIDTAVDILLGAAGVTMKSINIVNGQDLLEPLLLGESQGLINTAAQLAAASGYYLWQNKEGVVETQAMDVTATPDSQIAFERARLEMQRLAETELPYTKIIIRGTTTELEELPAQEIVQAGEYDPNTNSFTNKTTITRDFVNRTITTNKVEGFDIFQTITETVEQYEPIANITSLNGVVASPNECLPPDEGRLVSRTTSVIRNAAVAFASCEAHNQESLDVVEQDGGFFASGTSVRTISEVWDYQLSPAVIEDSKETILNLAPATDFSTTPGSISLSPFAGPTAPSPSAATAGDTGDRVTYTRTITDQRGVVSPIFCHWTLGNNALLAEFADTAIPPSGTANSTIIEKEVVIWNKNTDNQWRSERNVERSKIVIDQTEFVSRANAAETLEDIAIAKNGAFSRVNIVSEEKSDDTPPDPGRFPPRYTQKETDYERIFNVVGFGSASEERILTKNLDVFGEVDATTQRIGRANAIQSWGKNKGSQITSEFYSVDRPLAKVTIFDTPDSLSPYPIETYYIDNPSISISPENFVFSGLGLFINATDGPSLDTLAEVDVTNLIGFLDGGSYNTFFYTPVNEDYTLPNFIFRGTGVNGENIYSNTENTSLYFELGADQLRLDTGTAPALAAVSSANRQEVFINSLGQPVANGNLLVPPFTPNALPLVTILDQTGTSQVQYTTSTVSEPLLCTKYAFTKTFQIFSPATHIAEQCTRELDTQFNPRLPVIGSNEELPWLDLENNAYIAFVDGP